MTADNNDANTIREGGDWMKAKGLLKQIPISRRTLERWKARGQIPFARVGPRLILYRRSDVERMLERLTIRAIG